MPDAISAAVAAAPQQNQNTLTAEEVAGVVSSISTIGEACDALRNAGWRASTAGNRITVNDEVFALFISGRCAGGPPGDVGSSWMIYTITEVDRLWERHLRTRPVWVHAAEPQL
jgi:hypothetical protein